MKNRTEVTQAERVVIQAFDRACLLLNVDFACQLHDLEVERAMALRDLRVEQIEALQKVRAQKSEGG